MKRSVGVAIAALVAVATPIRAQATTGSLEIVGADGAVQIFAAADLAALPPTEVTVTEGASRAVFAGPSLRELLTLAGAPAGRSLRGPAMSLVVTAEAADGYTVAFTLSELDPQFGNRSAIVASTQDGGPLSERDGPLQIVVPADEFHARWVRQLVRLRLVQLPSGAGSTPHD